MKRTIIAVLIMVMLAGCKTSKNINTTEKEEHTETVKTKDSTTSVKSETNQEQSNFDITDLLNLNLTTGKQDCEPRTVYVKDKSGNEANITLFGGDSLSFFKESNYKAEIRRLTKKNDSLQSVISTLKKTEDIKEDEVKKDIKKEFSIKTLLPFSLIMCVVIIAFIISRYKRFKKHL